MNARKPIPGFEGSYEADDLGDIWSVARVLRRKDGSDYRVRARKLSPKLTKTGYSAVSLWVGGRHTTQLVHRLVLSAFTGQSQPASVQVNHINGIKTDNRVGNLEWCTAKENTAHAYSTLGKKHVPMAKGDDSVIAKPIAGKDKGGNTVVRYGSMTAATKDGFTLPGISACVHGNQKTHRGLTWSLLGKENA